MSRRRARHVPVPDPPVGVALPDFSTTTSRGVLVVVTGRRARTEPPTESERRKWSIRLRMLREALWMHLTGEPGELTS